MPDAHKDFLEWNGERFKKWAAKIGPSTRKVIEAILLSRKIEQQSYRSCRALLNLEKARGKKSLEEACEKALLYSTRPSYKTVKNILSTLREDIKTDDTTGAYLRGSNYYQSR